MICQYSERFRLNFMALQIDSKNKHVHVLEFDNWKIREVCEGPHTLLDNLKIH